MSIPLDRLYQFYESIAGSAVLIYRWAPHGSKKIQDLTPLKDYSRGQDLSQLAKIPAVICHDQEPLQFDTYADEDMNRHQYHCEAMRQGLGRPPETIVPGFFKNQHLRIRMNPSLHAPIILHSELYSSELAKYQAQGYIGAYIWSHAVIALDWFRYAKHDVRLNCKLDNVHKDFLVYNRSWQGTREYRLKFVELLIDHGIQKNCLTKFSILDNGQNYINHVFRNQSLALDRWDLQDFFEPNSSPSSFSADYDADDYAHTGIEVVLETLFDDERLHLTEKTLRPIACAKPFMLVSTPGALNYLRAYGFKTFSPYIDETYDMIEDSNLRLQTIVQEMQRISGLPLPERRRIWHITQQIAQYNKQYFFSGKFWQRIIKEGQQNLNGAINRAQQSDATGYLCELARYHSVNTWNHDELLDFLRFYGYKDFNMTPSHVSLSS